MSFNWKNSFDKNSYRYSVEIRKPINRLEISSPKNEMSSLNIKSMNNILSEITTLAQNQKIDADEYKFLIRVLLSAYIQEKYSSSEGKISDLIDQYINKIDHQIDKLVSI